MVGRGGVGEGSGRLIGGNREEGKHLKIDSKTSQSSATGSTLVLDTVAEKLHHYHLLPDDHSLVTNDPNMVMDTATLLKMVSDIMIQCLGAGHNPPIQEPARKTSFLGEKAFNDRLKGIEDSQQRVEQRFEWEDKRRGWEKDYDRSNMMRGLNEKLGYISSRIGY